MLCRRTNFEAYRPDIYFAAVARSPFLTCKPLRSSLVLIRIYETSYEEER